MEVRAWLQELGLERYAQVFADHHVDRSTLPWLTEADLTEMGVASLGHRRKLIAAIASLSPDASTQPADAAKSAPLPAERRQLSVLYCEVSFAAELPSRPEELREVVKLFNDACRAVVAEYEGHAANFFGDRLLAYFGWPRSHEDDVERAVRAGLALSRRVARLKCASGDALSPRVGIATGEVVVGDLIHEGPAREQSAVGLAPNLGARLLTLAAPGQVVIDELTRTLLPPNFALRPLGQHALKGLSEPTAAYAVIGEQAAESRFDARKGRDLTPMIGRDKELALLLARWAQARDGEGQVVMLMGEAGIGKSRLARALLDACASEPHETVRWQCSPYHAGSALWPVVQRLARMTELSADDSNDASLDKLDQKVGSQDTGAKAVYASLLGLDGTQRYGPLEMTPQMLRERTLELLVEQLHQQAEERALLLMVEDAHWIDPSTLELLQRCMVRIGSARLLLLITSRPDTRPQLSSYPSTMQLTLNRLNRASVHDIVVSLGGGGLTPQTLAAIVAQTDGVPLFVEEVTKAVLDRGEVGSPASLHGSLMARLDCIAEVKEVAQLAACIGREFDMALLQAVIDRPERVAPALEKLAATGIVYPRGERGAARFSFKHALVRDEIYDSVLRRRRAEIHARLVRALQDRKPGTPFELLAHHAGLAGLPEQAVDWWQQAGDAALAKSAFHEAAAHFEKAIEVLRCELEPDSEPERELMLQHRLGHALMGSQGYTATKTLAAFERAYALLGKAATASKMRMSVSYCLWAGRVGRAELQPALRVAREWLDAATDDTARMIACRTVGFCEVTMGAFFEGQRSLARAIALHDPQRHADLVAAFNVEPRGAAYCYLATAQSLTGSPAQGRAALDHAIELAGSLRHVLAKANLYFYCAVPALVLREGTIVAELADALTKLCDQHRLAYWGAYASLLHGAVCHDTQRHAEAVEHYERALNYLLSSGARSGANYFRARQGHALAQLGRVEDGLQMIDEAIEDTEETMQRWCIAEVWRLRGDVLLSGKQDADEARRSFERGLMLAREQGAKLWELRAATSLAALWTAQGRRHEAHELLAPILGSFTEGFDTPDWKDARSLLVADARQDFVSRH